MQEIYQKIRQYINENRQQMMDLWEELVNTESGPQQAEGVNAVCNILIRDMESADISTRIIPMEKAGCILVGEWNTQSSKAPMLFIGHTDTVFKPGAAKENPFRIDENGNARGPGVLDMKGGLVIALYAVKALAAVGYNDRPIKFVFAGDEETMHKFSNAKEFIALEVKNGIAAFNFETGYTDDGFVIGRKGGGIATITITGVSAHSGIAPENGRSAILEAAYKIAEIESKNDLQRGKLINCGLINGGIGENTIPGECKIGIGFRFPTIAIKEEILKDIEAAVEKSIVADSTATYEINMCMDCMETTDGVMRLFENLKECAADCGYGSIHPISVGGISDSSITVVCGVPTVCGMGCKGIGNHTSDEYADVESLFERSVLAACAVYGLNLD